MTLDIVRILAGLVLLGAGGEGLVRGAVGLAQRFRVSPLVIGLTIVSAATSMPELMVSVVAAFRGSPDVAVGNVVGSNIFNLGLVLGATAIVFPLPVDRRTLRVEGPFLLLVTLLCLGLMSNGTLGRPEGAALVFLLIVFLYGLVRIYRHDPETEHELEAAMPRAPLRVLVDLLLVGGGVAVMVFGADLVVDGATSIALQLGISERIVGLTIVAMGTSLPELASSLVAAARKRTDIAVGNVIGSSVFNLLAIFGIGSLLRPLTVDAAFFTAPRFWDMGDVWWMLLFTLLLGPIIVIGGNRIGRRGGAVLLALFVVYLAALIA
jgi:cation:H+ antiporter